MRKWIAMMAAVLMVMAAGTAMAATTTVDVSATVQGTCAFAGTGTLAFGVLPTDGSGASVSTSIDFTCSNGTPYTITDDDGVNELVANGNRMQSTSLGSPEYIPYTMTYTPTNGTGSGPGTPITLTIDGVVANGAYSTNSPDVYQDTVTLTILP